MEMTREQLAGGVVKITLAGSFDVGGAGDVDARFTEIGENDRKVIVDLGNVTFLASIGVHILVRTAKAINDHGGQMVVLSPNTASSKVLHATGVDTIIAIAGSEADALARFS